jgi:hypothetical protein
VATALEWVGDDKMMISADTPHAEAKFNSSTEIQERGDISEGRKRNSWARMPKDFAISNGEAE